MSRAFVGIGSNLGDREHLIGQAVAEMARLPRTRVARVSSLYDTDPMGLEDQPAFLNAVAALETDLSARELLLNLQRIETAMGRVRDQRWGPRTLDLDILLFGDEVHEEDDLTIPHAEMARRAFVLVPLCELEPDLADPRTGLPYRESLLACAEDASVRRLRRSGP